MKGCNVASHTSGWTIGDYSQEKSWFKVYNGPITVGTIAGFLTAFGNLQTALAGIIKGEVQQSQWVGDLTTVSSDWPTDEFAQRELKWLVTYKGNTTEKLFRFEVPTADPTGRLLPGSDEADMTNTEMAAFITAFETLAKSPDDDTEGVTVMSVRLVGRNL